VKKDLSRLDNILKEYLTLKKLRRTGWALRGIRDGESLADHCFGVTLLTMIFADFLEDLHLDRDKVLRMALIHELGECRLGDIPSPALEFLEGKSLAEREAFRDIFKGTGTLGENYCRLFREFEEAKTLEAKFVRAIDKLEMLITAADYEKIGFSALGDFWENEKTFETFSAFPEILEFALSLKKARQNPQVQESLLPGRRW